MTTPIPPTLQTPGLTPTEELITFRVSVLSQQLSRVVDAYVSAELGLSSRQWRMLVSLNRVGPSTAGDLARFAHLDKSQVSRAAHELEQRGLLTQSGQSADRRRVTLALTEEGRETLRQGLAGSESRQQRLQAALSAEDYAAFNRAVARLTEEAQAMLADARSRL